MHENCDLDLKVALRNVENLIYMVLEAPVALANRLESLYKHSKRPQSSLRGADGTTERRTDGPTDQQTNKRVSKTCKMVSIHAFTIPEEIIKLSSSAAVLILIIETIRVVNSNTVAKSSTSTLDQLAV